MLTVSS